MKSHSATPLATFRVAARRRERLTQALQDLEQRVEHVRVDVHRYVPIASTSLVDRHFDSCLESTILGATRCINGFKQMETDPRYLQKTPYQPSIPFENLAELTDSTR